MKDLSILARAARTLLIVMLLTMTAQTALAQTTLTLDPNHSGSTGCIIIPIEYGLNGYSYSLTNFNPANYPQFVRDGFTILSWNTSPTGGGTGYGANETVVLTVNQNLTLYAIWNSCNVTFISNGGTGTMEAVQVTGGTEYTIPACGFTKDGYVFLGWATSAGGAVVYKPGDQVILTDDLTLYAIWGKTSCNVNFYANGGSGSMDPVQVTGGTEYIIPANGFSRDGYLFLGWTTTANGSIVYRPGDIVTLVDDLTLYAVWGTEWSGSGTVDNPYQISEYTDLLQLAQYVNDGNDFSGKFFKLMNDISIPHTTDWNDATSIENNFTAIGTDPVFEHWFMGTFDGDGHTISGIRIYKGGDDELSDSFQGLFGLISGATIKNVTLADTRITGFLGVGGIVGGAYTSEVDNCHVLSNVAIHAVQENDLYGCGDHGGIAGSISNYDIEDITNGCIISNCTSAATLTVKSGIKGDDAGFGSIAGSAVYSTLRDNLAIGATIPIVKNSGAIIGSCEYTVLQRNYYSGCTVGTTPTANGIGVGDASSHDVTANDGAVPLLRDTYFTVTTANNETNVVFNRTFPAGKKQTVCLPFAPTALYSLGTVWEFTGISGNKAVMTQRTQAANGALKANTPYIFQATSDVTSITFNNVTVSPVNVPQTAPDGQNFIFYGTYGEKTWEADEAVAANIYGFMTQDNDGQVVGQFVKARRRTALRAFSCYLKYSGTGTLTDTDPASKARGITRGDSNELPDVIDVMWVSAPGSTTGIHTADAVVTTQRDGWYSLDGRRLSGKPATKGIYINNGRKVVIK